MKKVLIADLIKESEIPVPGDLEDAGIENVIDLSPIGIATYEHNPEHDVYIVTLKLEKGGESIQYVLDPQGLKDLIDLGKKYFYQEMESNTFDMQKAMDPDYEEFEEDILIISREGGVSNEVALEFLLEGLEWPLNDDDAYQWWIENVREDIETDEFNFIVKPSQSTWSRNMKDSPAKVSATLIYESIGDTGSEDAIFEVNVNWPKNSTSAPREKTYEMSYQVISDWSQDPSGTYFNANIRGKY